VVVWVKDSQDHSHREQACRCAVSVVHLGWVDPVPVVAQVTTNACCNSVSNKRLRQERVVVFGQLSCRDVASCPVVAAQECREQRIE
jgi:hypothetical protein